MSLRNMLFALLLFSFCTLSTAQGYIVPPMVNIPAGKFMMGAEGGDPATMPIHPVSVNAFQLGKYTVTVAEFRKFAEDTGLNHESTCNDFMDKRGLGGPNSVGTARWDKHKDSFSEYQPVTCVSWKDANAYASWLSKKTGVQYRLPTEQEWEYATKANTTSRYFWGDDLNLTQACLYGNSADQTGEHVQNQTIGYSNLGHVEHNNCDDGETYITIVGMYRPNPFGLYDMVGNVSHFLNSCYNKEGYSEDSKAKNDLMQCELVVHRGGNWHYPSQPHSARGRAGKEGVGSGMGFRLASDTPSNKLDVSTAKFEAQLKLAQASRLATRPKLIAAPQNVQLGKLGASQYRLSWQASSDPRVTGYDIYQSKSSYAHFYGGFYQDHYEKVKTVNLKKSSASLIDTSIKVSLPDEGGSFRVVATSDNGISLPSKAVAVVVAPKAISIPGRIHAQHAIALENITLVHREASAEKAEFYVLSKVNKNSDQSLVTASFSIDVKKTGWYRLNYQGKSLQTREFFKLWQDNFLVGEIGFDPAIDDKISKRHKVFLEQGTHTLQLSVLRAGFDMWSMTWLEFSETDG